MAAESAITVKIITEWWQSLR